MKKDKPTSKRGHRRPPQTDASIFEAMHEEALRTEGVMELGATTPSQGGLFEKIRAGITHGEVLKFGFDQAVKLRCRISREEREMPPVVDEATFDADVLRIQKFTDEEVEQFDKEVCHARMETRDESGGGVYTSKERVSGFGRDVFGIAYDGASGLWSATNEHGLHAHCEEHLWISIEELKGRDFKSEIISGFIFKLLGLETPIMTPFGYSHLSPKAIRKAVEDLWAWKRFILIDSVKVAPKKTRWKQLFTPEYAEGVVHVE